MRASISIADEHLNNFDACDVSLLAQIKPAEPLSMATETVNHIQSCTGPHGQLVFRTLGKDSLGFTSNPHLS